MAKARELIVHLPGKQPLPGVFVIIKSPNEDKAVSSINGKVFLDTPTTGQVDQNNTTRFNLVG